MQAKSANRERLKPLEGQMHLFGELPVAYCRRCRRLLKDPRSRERGLGPSCFQREFRQEDTTNERDDG